MSSAQLGKVNSSSWISHATRCCFDFPACLLGHKKITVSTIQRKICKTDVHSEIHSAIKRCWSIKRRKNAQWISSRPRYSPPHRTKSQVSLWSATQSVKIRQRGKRERLKIRSRAIMALESVNCQCICRKLTIARRVEKLYRLVVWGPGEQVRAPHHTNFVKFRHFVDQVFSRPSW